MDKIQQKFNFIIELVKLSNNNKTALLYMSAIVGLVLYINVLINEQKISIRQVNESHDRELKLVLNLFYNERNEKRFYIIELNKCNKNKNNSLDTIIKTNNEIIKLKYKK